MTTASKPPPPVNFPVRRSVLMASIFSAPPMVLMYLATISSEVCAETGMANSASPIITGRILHMIYSLNLPLRIRLSTKPMAVSGYLLLDLGRANFIRFIIRFRRRRQDLRRHFTRRFRRDAGVMDFREG